MNLSRRSKEKDFKRRLIAEAALELFANNSCEAVTMEDIARASEYGKGTLYQYFQSKDSIILFLLGLGLEQVCNELAHIISQSTDFKKSLSQAITVLFRYYTTYAQPIIYWFRRRTEGTWSPEVYADAMEKKNKRTLLLAQLLRTGMQDGMVIQEDPERLARMIENLIKGFTLDERNNPQPGQFSKQDLELVMTILNHGILTPEGRV